MNLPFRFTVVPRLPAEIEPLWGIAYNLWWSWNNEARNLFRDLDPELWERVGHAPVRLLRKVSGERLLAAASDPAFVERVRIVDGLTRQEVEQVKLADDELPWLLDVEVIERGMEHEV